MVKSSSLRSCKEFELLFINSCRKIGLEERERVSIISKIDPSVFFIGSGISVFKSDLFTAIPNKYILQPCFRSHNLNIFVNNFDYSYSSFFISPCIVSDIEYLENILILIKEFHSSISQWTLQIEVHYEDIDIYNKILFLSEYGINIKKCMDSKTRFRHYYGDNRLMGKTIHFRVIYEDTSVSRIFANLSIIYIDGKLKGIDYGTGISTYISCLKKQRHSIESSPISDLYSIKKTNDIIFCDCLTSVYEISSLGIKPLANKRGRILREYLSILMNTSKLLNITSLEINVLLEKYEKYINNKNSLLPYFISEYIEVYQKKENSVLNINKYISENVSWYK